MHGDTQRDLIQTLNSMAKEAWQRNYGDRPAAHRDTVRAIRNDRRFDWADADVLAKHHREMEACCGVLKLDDPRLRRGGGQAPPLARDTYW
jgi:hypothetical protein